MPKHYQTEVLPEDLALAMDTSMRGFVGQKLKDVALKVTGDVAKGAATAPFTLAPDLLGLALKGGNAVARHGQAQLGLPPMNLFPDDFSGDPIRELVGLDPESLPGMAGELLDPTATGLKAGKLAASNLDKAITMFAVWTPEFRKMFANATDLLKKDGKPIVLYHGSTGEIERFNLELASPDSDWGRAIYMSTNIDDVNANYAGFGPDLTNRINRKAEDILDNIWEDSYQLDEAGDLLNKHPDDLTDDDMFDYAKHLAKEEMQVAHHGAVTPLLAAIENPAVVAKPVTKSDIMAEAGARLNYQVRDLSGKPIPRPPDVQETFFTLDFAETADGGIEYEGTLMDFIDAMRENADHYYDVDVDAFAGDLLRIAEDQGGLRLSEVKQGFAVNEHIAYASDFDTGEMMPMEFLRETLEEMGFDGVIDYSAGTRFSSMRGMTPDTAHVIAFDPDKVNTAFAGEYPKLRLLDEPSYTVREHSLPQRTPEEPMVVEHRLPERTQSKYDDFLNRAIQREQQEIQGQAILDDLIETEISPQTVSDKFWRETYPALNPEMQKQFQGMIRGLGFDKGDVLWVDRQGNQKIGETWEEIGRFLGEDFSNSAEYLEGPERGFVALMEWANRQTKRLK